MLSTIQRIRLFIIVSTVIILLTSNQTANPSYLFQAEQSRDYACYASHTTQLPLNISSNSELIEAAVSHGWSGSGTASDPYVIENYVIDTDALNGICISIENVTLHFIIRNCDLSSTDFGGYSVFLHNVTNGIITQCTMVAEYWAFYAIDCSNIDVIDSDVSGEDACIIIEDSSDCTVYNCTLSGHIGAGLYFDNCNHSVALLNDVDGTHADSQSGISAFGDTSWNCSVSNNEIYNHWGEGIRIGARDCIVDGNSVHNNGAGIWLMEESSNTTVTNNILSMNAVGNARDDGADNTWISNSYDDYNGWGAYPIRGYAQNVEYLPLSLVNIVFVSVLVLAIVIPVSFRLIIRRHRT